MLIDVFVWIYIVFSAFLLGFAGLQILKKINGYFQEEADVYFVFGICLLTVYAEFFSLFHKVGLLANIFLIILDAIFICLFWRDIFSIVKLWKGHKRSFCYILIVTILLGLVFLKYASDPIEQYDTYLYHAQAIRWIEEYGVVPGLGNLHSRLAYNNSIFSLQALFSFSFFLRGGRSLHGINGFICLLFMTYAVCSLKVLRTHRFHTSDFFRVALVYYIASQKDMISSPYSDLFAQGMILYILTKWITRLEGNKIDYKYYIDLCLMCVFAVSIKLSAAMIVLLALVPAARLIREKKWNEIGVYMIYGVIMILPFLVRNVIISGYLIYPYPELDLFHLDWKMPAYTLVYDRNEIKVWGNGLKDVARYSAPFSEWFPIWKEELNRLQLLEVYAFPFLAVISFSIGIIKAFKQKVLDYLEIVIVMMAIVLFWLCGAPGLRFGGTFLLLLPCFAIGKLAERFDDKIIESDYEVMECREVHLGTEQFYVPIEGDQAGYYDFPSSPYEAELFLIEMRGSSLKDGFRMKNEYKDAFIRNDGIVMEENIFK